MNEAGVLVGKTYFRKQDFIFLPAVQSRRFSDSLRNMADTIAGGEHRQQSLSVTWMFSTDEPRQKPCGRIGGPETVPLLHEGVG